MSIQYTTEEQIAEMRKELQIAKQKAEDLHSHRFLHMVKISAKILGHALFYSMVVFLLVVLVSILIAKGKGKIPSILGYQMFVVESGSMSPTLEVGAVIVSKTPKDNSSLTLGTIITFHTKDGAVVTHRIIEVMQNESGGVEYRTKGDNPVNSVDKDSVSPDRVIAVFVAKIPFT